MNTKKSRVISYKNLFVIFLLIISFFIINKPANAYDEAYIRIIMLDITLGGTYSYFRSHSDEPGPAEAIRRWDSGIRVTNADQFERKQVYGEWRQTYRGTNGQVDGMEVRLTSDHYGPPPRDHRGPQPEGRRDEHKGACLYGPRGVNACVNGTDENDCRNNFHGRWYSGQRCP